jgi:hypothetical protein
MPFLKEQDLDYTLHELKPHAPSIYDYYTERMKEYTPKLEIWEKPDRIAKMIIRYSISFDMRSFFPTEQDNRELSAKELHNSIRAHFKKVFLVDKLLSSCYDGIWVTTFKVCLIWLMS